ncbi:MAG: fibrillarin-like rRNA/tRNA 2'-O-methyltransferase [Candidatus Woesearchaeota archaeon]
MQQINKFSVYKQGKKLFVKTKYPAAFSEKIISFEGQKYKEANPERSKFFAAIAKGLSQTGIKEDSKILYLGASHGYTVSYMCEIVNKGLIFAVDFAPSVMKDLVFFAEKRENIIPIYADANKPEEYKEELTEIDVLFQDIAQREQVKIFLKNMELIKKGGFGLLALKSRSIDITKKPKQIFQEARKELEKKHVIVDYRELHPFEKDHAFFVVKKK